MMEVFSTRYDLSSAPSLSLILIDTGSSPSTALLVTASTINLGWHTCQRLALYEPGYHFRQLPLPHC